MTEHHHKVFNSNDYIPKRFGLNYSPPQIIIEYLAPSTGKLYHHKMRLHKFTKEKNTGEIMKELFERHQAYLDKKKISSEQLVRLIERLKQNFVPRKRKEEENEENKEENKEEDNKENKKEKQFRKPEIKEEEKLNRPENEISLEDYLKTKEKPKEEKEEEEEKIERNKDGKPLTKNEKKKEEIFGTTGLGKKKDKKKKEKKI